MYISSPFTYAENAEVIDSQKENLNIGSFIKEANKYTQEIFPDIDTSDLLNSAIKGEVDNKNIFQKILNPLGGQFVTALKILGSILAVVVIGSVIKTLSENLENQSVAQITYYVQYILMVGIMLANFSEVVTLAKNTIQDMIGFMYTLVPLLITLMITTGSIVSANLAQPIILFGIGFIGNMLTTIILPIIMVGTVLGIVSNISDKIQLGKLAKFFKTSIIWILGIVLTLFVGLLSLEGTLSSSIDGITAKTAKAAVSRTGSSSGENLRRFNRHSFRKCSGIKKRNRASWHNCYNKHLRNTGFKTCIIKHYIQYSGSALRAYCR